MARYFFDTRNGNLLRDDEGIECDSLDAVRFHALAGLADFAKDAVRTAKWRELSVEIRDQEDQPVMQMTLKLSIKMN